MQGHYEWNLLKILSLAQLVLALCADHLDRSNTRVGRVGAPTAIRTSQICWDRQFPLINRKLRLEIVTPFVICEQICKQEEFNLA